MWGAVRSRLIVAAALAGLVSAAHGGSAPDALDSPPADRTVIGKVSTIPITADDIVGKDPAAFEHLQQLREQQAHELELQYRKAYHELLSRNLTRELDRRALELESADRHVPAQTIIGEITTPDVTDEQVRAFYDARKARTDQPFEQLQASIRQYLADQQRDAAISRGYLFAQYAGARDRDQTS